MDNKKGISHISDISFILLVCFCSFLIWYLTNGYALIDQPFIWNDLHLIRSYNLEEILNAWVGTHDPDNIETPGYRPIGVLFYNFLGHIFKENTFYLRIFIFLMSLSLIVLVNISLLKIGFTRIGLAIFSVLIIFSKIFTTLVSWMSMSGQIFCYISAFISLIHYNDGEKRYIVTPVGLKVGDTIQSGEDSPLKVGNTLPLKNIPTGLFVHNVELANSSLNLC